MKKVLHIFGAMNRGGAEMRTLSLMESMQAQGVQFDFCVLSGEKGVLDEQIRRLGGQVYYCKLGPLFIFHYFHLLKKYRFDVVHSHVAYVSGFILFLAWLAGVKKRIAHFRNTTAGHSRSIVRLIRDKILRGMLELFATDILAVCNGAMLGFWGAAWASDPKCRVIYNGFSIPELIPTVDFWTAHIAGYSGQQVVINVARMDVQKNHLRQCDIFQQLQQINPDSVMVFIGKEDPERKRLLLEKIQTYGLQNSVHFLGLQKNVLDFMQHAHVLLFPSEWEGLPGVVLEAASVGLPVVASDLPGIEEIQLQIEAVQIVKRTQTDGEWANALQHILNHPPDSNNIIQAFKNSDFLMANNVKQLNAVYAK